MSDSPPARALRLLETFATKYRALLAKLGWLALILLALGHFKIELSEIQDSLYIDGGYYTTVAIFVRDGLGLQTNVSLYHQAYSYFPHPTSVSPLWPLLYGYAARLWPIFDVAIWLPTFLYFTSLFCAWGWGSSLMPKTLVKSLPHFDAGHVLVLMLGIHREFVQFTSAPYTEGLAFTVLFAVLWRFNHALHEPKKWQGLEIGALLAVAMLARAQFVILAIAVFMAFAWAIAASNDRRRWLWVAAGAAMSFVAIIGSYYLWLRTFVGNSMIDALLRFDQGWETPVLGEFHPMKNIDGFEEYVKDRAEGFEVAFDYEGEYPYRRSYWFLQYAIPAAFPFFFVTMGRWANRDKLRQLWDWLRTDEAVKWLFVVLLALGGFFSIHTIHKDYFSEWHFHRRQGLTAILLFFLCLVYLFRRRWVGPTVAAIILSSSLYLGFTNLGDQIEVAEKRKTKGEPGARYNSLAEWLEKERKKRGKLTVAMAAQGPQRIAFKTPDVGYHWVYWKTQYKDIEVLVEDLGVDYILLHRGTSRWAFKRDKRFRENFKRLTSRSGIAIYVRK